jgi:hypothetical protein
MTHQTSISPEMNKIPSQKMNKNPQKMPTLLYFKRIKHKKKHPPLQKTSQNLSLQKNHIFPLKVKNKQKNSLMKKAKRN